MRNWTMILMVAGILGNTSSLSAEEKPVSAPKGTERLPSRPLSTKKPMHWETDYKTALKKAKESNKNLYLFFTGSDWCTWCTKMEKEFLESQDFMNTVGDRLLFVKVDLPRKTKLAPAIAEQNQALATRFKVRTFPSVVLLTPNEEVIWEDSGSPTKLTPQRYAEVLVELVAQKGKK